VAGEFLEIEYLFAARSDGLQDAALAAAGGAADDGERQPAGNLGEAFDDQSAIGLVAAFSCCASQPMRRRMCVIEPLRWPPRQQTTSGRQFFGRVGRSACAGGQAMFSAT
jgi:hypothetical protein